MSSIMQVQQDLLGRMQQLQEAAGSSAIKPAAEAAPDAGGLFMSAMRSVEAVNGVMFATMFPITFLANTFAPYLFLLGPDSRGVSGQTFSCQ